MEAREAAQGAEHFGKKPSSFQNAVYRAIGVRRVPDRQKNVTETSKYSGQDDLQRSSQQLINLVFANAGALIQLCSSHLKTGSHTVVTRRFPCEKALKIFIPKLFLVTHGI